MRTSATPLGAIRIIVDVTAIVANPKPSPKERAGAMSSFLVRVVDVVGSGGDVGEAMVGHFEMKRLLIVIEE